jgi:signal transduction histidine kinase
LRQLFKAGPAQKHPIDMNGLVRDSLKLAHGQLDSLNVDLLTELADGLPPIRGDRVQLQQLLLNLITNACNAMSGVEDTERQLIVRTGFSAGEGIRVTVSDWGHGIAERDLPRIFDPFFTTRPDGMGLTVCRTIVSAHRGRLWAENNPHRGASFHFALPLSDGEQAAPQRDSQ